MSRRLLAAILALLLGVPSGLRAQSTDPELAKGVAQVENGEYADALITLDGVAKRLEGAKTKDRSQVARAYLYLGIAYIGLNHEEAAKSKFQAALSQVPDLTLSPDQFPPKVIEAFEAARHQGTAAKAGGGSKKTLVLVGVGVAAAAGIALAASGGSSAKACESGKATFGNARFETPVFTCPVGSQSLVDPASVLIDASNTTCSPVTISHAGLTLSVTATFHTTNPVGQSFVTDPAQFQPASIPAGGSATIRVTPDLTCSNPGSGGAFNELSGSVTLTTSAGTYSLTTTNRHQTNFP